MSLGSGGGCCCFNGVHESANKATLRKQLGAQLEEVLSVSYMFVG